MMPWPDDHKARTHERIVQAAAAAFRAGGVAGVRLEDVMARAGLTHGGFYAHFASKEELLREALEHASTQTVDMLSKPLASVPDESRLRVVSDAYLSPAHVAHPERGCPLATLGPEIARTGGPTHAALAEGVKGRLEWMRQLVPEDQREAASDDQIIGTLACMIGGVILARTVGGKDSAAVLEACRDFLRRNAGQSGKRSSSSRSKPRQTLGAAARVKRTGASRQR
jgi:TetR/AcrR family transcriptional regulator, transcriptional repressor for nem operon